MLEQFLSWFILQQEYKVFYDVFYDSSSHSCLFYILLFWSWSYIKRTSHGEAVFSLFYNLKFSVKMMPSLYGNYGSKDTIIHKTEHNILSDNIAKKIMPTISVFCFTYIVKCERVKILIQFVITIISNHLNQWIQNDQQLWFLFG